MHEALYNAKAELKRADHLIFVSLKYTRTVDVIKNIIERLISTFDNGFDALLKHAIEQGKITTIPELPRLKVEALNNLFGGDEMMMNFLKFYLLLRKISKAAFTRSQEYRRHVAMIAEIDEDKIEINIDIINDYYEKTKEFISMIEARFTSVTA